MTESEVFEVLKGNILEILPGVPPENVQPGISMRTLGANSIDRADIVIKTMSDLALKVSLLDFAAARDIGGVAGIFAGKLREKAAA
jgi:polyketide biosynthesis acyl carrier protein